MESVTFTESAVYLKRLGKVQKFKGPLTWNNLVKDDFQASGIPKMDKF